ncbi:MAG: SMC-Scp complex subunit ScpB [Myxococcales bacterium]
MSEFEQEPEGESEASEGAQEAQEADAGTDTLGPGEADLSLSAEGEGDEDDEDGLGRPGLAGAVALADHDLRAALEALILVSDKPVAAVRLARLTRQDPGAVKRALSELAEQYRGRGIVLDEIAGGFQFRTSPRYAPFVRTLVQQKPTKLSRAQLEVLAIIAYRQPITRPEIEDVRGVDSGSAIKVLLERNVLKIIGKKDEAGRPMLYGTTNEFLELFGLKSLRDLPTLKEFTELSAESRDIFERRIGAPLPGFGQGMNLETHYEAAPSHGDEDEGGGEGNEAQGEAAPEGQASAEDHAEDAGDSSEAPADEAFSEAEQDNESPSEPG